MLNKKLGKILHITLCKIQNNLKRKKLISFELFIATY